MPETLYQLGKAAGMDGDDATAEKCWQHLLTLESNTSLAAQAHFGLSGIYRKQGRPAEADREMEAFRKLQAKPSHTDASPKCSYFCNSRSSDRKPMGNDVLPCCTRSARATAIRGANLKPWPEKPAAKTTLLNSG